MKESWVKLFSKLTEWQWYKDQNTKSLFIHCLLKANWKDGKFEGVDVPRGSFVTSLPNLAKELGLTIQGVRTALKHLILTGELTVKTTNKFRVITIKNYELYQQINIQDNIQLTDNQQTTNRQDYKICENLTDKTTGKNFDKSVDLYNENYNIDFEVNSQDNIQLTGKTKKYAKNQQQYKTIDKNIDNSVCNAHAREEFVCHLGCKQKTINCINCMKKYQCPIEEEPMFKQKYGQAFYEYLEAKIQKEKELAEQFETMETNIVPIDYDYLNESEE